MPLKVEQFIFLMKHYTLTLQHKILWYHLIDPSNKIFVVLKYQKTLGILFSLKQNEIFVFKYEEPNVRVATNFAAHFI